MKFGVAVCILAVLLVKCDAVPARRMNVDEKIVGGHEVTIEEYPYQASVLYHGFHTCGGVLYNENKYVLTAAHCVFGKEAWAISVRAGSPIRNYGGVVKSVLAAKIMEGFDSTSLVNDIAVLVMVEQFPEADYMKSVEVVESPVTLPIVSTVSGWGTTQEGGTPSSILLAVDVSVYEKATCKTIYGDLITDTMLCAGIDAGGKDACEGDSGGPLVNRETVGTFTLVGLVSWGFGCGRKDYPGVYTDVAEEQVMTFINT